MKKQVLSLLVALVLLVTAFAVIGQAEQPGAYMVALDGTETPATDPMAEWTAGQYEYIKLYGEVSLTIPANTAVYVDLNGKALTVAGEGELYAFDSANDGYDTDACGTVTNTGAVDVKTDVTAPLSGYRYLALTNENVTAMHRIGMVLRAVTLRTDAVGLYYKATYNCDATLAAAVESYGVILSLANMPGADFAEETEDINKATSVTPDENFGNGTQTTSGSVFNIMKQDQGSITNFANASRKIYANAYLRVNGAVVVADTRNVGKAAYAEDFDGIAYSLRDTLEGIDGNYYAYTRTDRAQVEQFHAQWKNKGIRWSMEKVGKQKTIDNSNLNLVDGVAYCPVCEKDVTWTPIVSRDTALRTQNGGHYYLAEAVVTMDVPNASKSSASNAANGAVIVPPAGATACLHLNGNKLDAPINTAIFGSSDGTLNVMGNGEVKGFIDKTGVGNAVQLNTTNGVVNLYGGHYTQPEGKGVLFCATSGGGLLNVYAPCTVGEHADLRLAAGTRASTSKIALYGVDLSGSKLSFADTNNRHPEKKCVLELVDSQFGTATVSDWTDVVIRGESTATLLTLNEEAKLTVGQLAPTASIGIKTDGGMISKVSEYAGAAVSYIKPNNAYQRITVKNGALRCDKDYVTNEPVQKGYCPVCQKSVTWQQLTGATAMASGDHYYLPSTQNYTNSDASFINAPTSGTACLHLNGFDINATAAKAIYGASGTLNVMGTGTVTGYTASTVDSVNGAAVQINNKVGGKINLYGGIYQQAGNVHRNSSTICIRNNGGIINIYEDAKVLSATTGKAIYVGDGTGGVTGLGLYGTKVTGDVHVSGAVSTNIPSIALDNATVKGEMIVNGQNTLSVRRRTVIDYLKLTEATTLTLDSLKNGADITVHTNGKFTASNDKAADYAGYFKAYNPAGSVTAENNVLVYSVDYSKPLNFTEGTTAMCPLCETEVQWQALVANEDGTMQTLTAGGHYYLSTDQTFTSSDTTNQYAFVKAPGSGAACLHLNGKKLTATNAKAIFGNGGVLNVMGSGQVAGYSSSSNTGAAIQVNSAVNGNAINLYSGTYKRYNSGDTVAVVAISNGGTVNVHKGAAIEGGNGTALYLGRALTNGNAELNLLGATVNGNLATEVKPDGDYKDAILYTQDATVNGTVDIKGENNVVTFEGKTVISQLNVAKGLLVNFVDMMPGSSVKVSADGVFTKKMDEADHYAPYFTTGDEGDWVICKDYTLYQEVKTLELPADETDKAQLESVYEGSAPYHGELHNHTNTDGADGNNSLEEWIVHMQKNDIDFATIVDHGQTTHMYKEAWDDICFIGGSEPDSEILDSKATKAKNMHYNMIFADAKAFEEHLLAFTRYDSKGNMITGDSTSARTGNFQFTYATEDKNQGGTYKYPKWTVEGMKENVLSILNKGGFFTHVHPKFDSYIISDDPEDYWFGDGTGIEVSTTDTKPYNMAYKDNNEAYEMWVDLLELDHRVFATLGDDNHLLSNLRSLSTIYSAELEPQALVNKLREGNLTAGPVGIRMSIGNVATGGITTFDAGKRLVLSVGDIHTGVYNAKHKYAVELYDDGGILFTTEINPTETTYFAMDIDTNRKFYRAVVVDLTEGTPIAVGNPVFNSDYYAAFAWLGETAE